MTRKWIMYLHISPNQKNNKFPQRISLVKPWLHPTSLTTYSCIFLHILALIYKLIFVKSTSFFDFPSLYGQSFGSNTLVWDFHCGIMLQDTCYSFSSTLHAVGVQGVTRICIPHIPNNLVAGMDRKGFPLCKSGDLQPKRCVFKATSSLARELLPIVQFQSPELSKSSFISRLCRAVPCRASILST
jgi:hypothetical protein